MVMKIKGFILSAVKSGSGKTIASLSVMKALMDSGYDVIPFKSGPDFIDTSHYQYVCDISGRNLDSFFMTKDFMLWNIKDAMEEKEAKNPIIVVEGAMGLFDGYGEKGKASTAELARKLDLPVILVVDAKGMGQSVGALISGFKRWERRVKVKGVIFNNVGSERHLTLLSSMAEKVGVKTVGYLLSDEDLAIPARHLGIIMGYERKKVFDDALTKMSKNIDVKQLLSLCEDGIDIDAKRLSLKKSNKKIYIAYDKAFCFCYKENIRILNMLGDVKFFSPLTDGELKSPDFIYIPGGYPELYGKELSENKKMLNFIRDYVEGGGALLAECGGLIYLSKSLKVKDDKFSLCGVFPFEIEMGNRFYSLGYVEVETKENPLFGNTKFKGHKFHYSFISNKDIHKKKSYILKRHNKIEEEGFIYKKAVCSYVHLHFGSNVGALEKMINHNLGG